MSQPQLLYLSSDSQGDRIPKKALCCAPHPPLTHPITATPSLIKTMLGHNPYSSLGTTASSVWKFCYAQVLCLFPSVHYCSSKLNTLKEKVHMTVHSATLLLLYKCDNNPKDSPMKPVWKLESFLKNKLYLSNVKKYVL